MNLFSWWKWLGESFCQRLAGPFVGMVPCEELSTSHYYWLINSQQWWHSNHTYKRKYIFWGLRMNSIPTAINALYFDLLNKWNGYGKNWLTCSGWILVFMIIKKSLCNGSSQEDIYIDVKYHFFFLVCCVHPLISSLDFLITNLWSLFFLIPW